MKISRAGSTFFLFVSENKKNKVEIIIDPKEKDLRTKAGVFLFSSPIKEKNRINGDVFVIDGPGEYEVSGVFILGIRARGKDGEELTIYTIDAEEIKLGYLGQIAQKQLSDAQLETMNSIDILMVPVGTGADLSPKETVKLISQIEPFAVVPIYSEDKKEEKKLKEFLKEMGASDIEETKILDIKKKDLKEGVMRIFVLSN